MAVRLAVYMKDVIQQALLERAFGERQKAINAAKAGLGDKVYKEMYTLKERRFMVQAPDGFLPQLTSVRVQFAGDFAHLSLSAPRPGASEQRTKKYDANHPYTDTFRDLNAKQKELEADRRQAKAELRAKLDSVSTVARLIEVWPEVRPFAAKFLEKKVAEKKLPVIQNDALNNTFKLPVEPAKTRSRRA